MGLIVPRPYQLEAVERVRRLMRQGKKRVILCAPTGSGKTVIAAHIVTSATGKRRRVLFIAHRRELIKQTFAKLVRDGIDPSRLSIVMAGVSKAPSEPFLGVDCDDDEMWRRYARQRDQAEVYVASVDTLRNRSLPDVGLIIIDETHRAMAATYRKILSAYPEVHVLGLTATPFRADGKPLKEAYQGLTVVSTPIQLIGLGYLAEPVVYTAPANQMPDLSGVHIRRGDYREEELGEAVDRPELVGSIVQHWKERSEGRRTVVFAASIAHSQHVVDQFRAEGIGFVHLDANSSKELREATLAALTRGEIAGISQCALFTEGWDCPPVKCCVLARPTKSLLMYMQAAGRILRPWEGVVPLILDHAGCAYEHGLPHEDREYSLEHPPKATRKAPLKRCPKCWRMHDTWVRRCECGYEFAVGPAEKGEGGVKIPGESAGLLQQMTMAERQKEKQEFLDRCCKQAVARNFRRKLGWVSHRFFDKYNLWPDNMRYTDSFLASVSSDERASKFDHLRDVAAKNGYSRRWVVDRYTEIFRRSPSDDGLLEYDVSVIPEATGNDPL
jgi:superfamily II DNA or RNA helicase